MTKFVLVETKEGHAAIPVDDIQYVFDREDKSTVIKHGSGDGVHYTYTIWRAHKVYQAINRAQRDSERGYGCSPRIYEVRGEHRDITFEDFSPSLDGKDLVEGGHDPRG